MTLFKNKYRVESTRLKSWDYSSDGYYFVTICTKNRKEYFGEIKNGMMGLNEMGCMAAKCWQEIPEHYPFVELDEWIVMPNHVHGIICINKNHNSVETQNLASLRNYDLKYNRFGPQSKNLAAIIRGFKIGVTKYAKSNNIDFKWQGRFHDHIIRNDKSLYEIQQYILNNPYKWEQDRNNPDNLWM